MDTPLDDTALRTLVDLRDAYDATLRIWREQDQVDGRLVWKTVKGRDYLYHVYGNTGNGTSLGPRSVESEAHYAQFREKKALVRERLADTEPNLKRAAAMYVGAGLPVINSWGAKLFQHLDRAGLMGNELVVVGTNAMPAYQLEAQIRTGQRIHATRDTDLAWIEAEDPGEAVLWPVLREFDPTFTINQERPFQAVGRGHQELELLSAPATIAALRNEPFRTASLPEQEWLRMGTPLRHVVSGLDRTPAAIVVPDPRYFALHKAWLSEKKGRDTLKAPKDRRQAKMVWSWLALMPIYPVDAAFIASLPEPLGEQARRTFDGCLPADYRVNAASDLTVR